MIASTVFYAGLVVAFAGAICFVRPLPPLGTEAGVPPCSLVLLASRSGRLPSRFAEPWSGARRLEGQTPLSSTM